VDLWDLTKLLFRRWYAFLPLLLVSVAIVVLITNGVKPDYSASGHLQLIPPAGATSSGTSATTTTKKVSNPWMDLGFQALGNAVVLKVQDKQVLDGLAAAGYTTSFTVTIEYNTTYFSIEAVGTTSDQATRTVQRLMKILDQQVTSQQAQFGVSKQDSITTLALDSGDKVKVVTSKMKRVLIVTGGAAVLLSAAATIALDALLRRRSRRRAGSTTEAESDQTAPVAMARTGSGRSGAARSEAGAVGSRRASNGVRDGALVGASGQANGGQSNGSLSNGVPSMSGSAGNSARADNLPAGVVRDNRTFRSEHAPDSQHAAPDVDATVILPMPFSHSNREDKSKGR
jgi:hypothetical protein